MAAHVPRRFFAAPFVVTAGFGTIAACNGGSATPPPQQPETPASASATPTAMASASASAAPVDPPSAATTWKVTKTGTTCESDKQVLCNTSAACPPHPKPYACPPEVTLYPATVSRKVGATECTLRIVPDMRCPPNTPCNPPPPHDVAVPCPD